MRRSFAGAPLLAFASCVACGGPQAGSGEARAVATASPSDSIAASVPPAPPSREDGRLPATATPQRYRVALRIDPSKPRFSGTVTIQIDVPEPTWHVVLHARDLTVSRAVARVGPSEIVATASARLAAGGIVPEELVLSFARPLPAGPVSLEIIYDAPFAIDLAGVYRVEEGGRWYVYTQFESTDARRAFPCFDEPGFKTAYDVTIAAPREMTVLANSPEQSRVDATDGTVVHTFATSPPLPSYLVAFAVGEFDMATGQTDPFPIRVVTTKGRSDLASLALDVAAGLAAKLGEYFDMRYPYAKLDLVAVPDFAAGAMENPGLVTFRDTLLLLDPQHATTSIRRAQAEVIAHELAHQWVGDLVTMQWWNDVWLNEGFATWAEGKIVDAWKPSFDATLGQIAGVGGVMDTDALRSARAVREPVRSTSEAKEAFDGITYDKGAAVLRMIESWIGPDMFRRGVQRYVHENAWKTATADDLFKAIEYVSLMAVGRFASGFLDQTGVPEVLASWKCGGGANSKLELRQSEWRPLGAGGDPPRKWTLPVCVVSDVLKVKSCVTLGAEPIARDLGTRCPSWVMPNADQAGYYRFVVDRAQLLGLAQAARSLGPADRIGLVSNAWAGVRQGAIPASALLELLPSFDGDTSRLMVDQIVGVLGGIDHALVLDETRGAYQKYVATRLTARARALGWGPGPPRTPIGKAGESDDDRALERRTLLWALGELANDPKTFAAAEPYAVAWLRDARSISADIAAVAVPLASMRAGERRLEELRAAVKSASVPQDRVLAIRAMGVFDDPAVLRKALDLTLTDELKLSDLHYLFGAAASHRVARPVLYAWEKDNWAKLRERLPGSFGRGMLLEVAGTMCTAAEQDDARSFFTAGTQGLEGVKRPLEEALEAASLCSALRQYGAADVKKYLGH